MRYVFSSVPNDCTELCLIKTTEDPTYFSQKCKLEVRVNELYFPTLTPDPFLSINFDSAGQKSATPTPSLTLQP